MPTRLRLFYSALTLTLLFIPAVALYSAVLRRADIVCTPPAAALDRLPWLLLYAAAIGAGAALLLVVATGRLAYRGEREPVVPS
jgi:hypothetical protein